MYGYAGSSAAAAAVTPFTKPADTTNPSGAPTQAAAVAKAGGTQAGTTAQSAAQSAAQAATSTTTPQTLTATSTTQALQQVSTTAGTTTGSTTTQTPAWLTPADFTTLRQTLQAYFGAGIPNYVTAFSRQFIADAAAPAAAAAGAKLGAGVPTLGSIPLGSPVSASAASANSLGRLSVPASWAAGTPAVSPASLATPLSLREASQVAGSQGLLRGMPLGGVGRRAAGGFTHRYGFRYSVMPRPPSAG